jgi:hypothetical protein
MNTILCDGLWQTVRRLAKRAASKRAAVAYVTTDSMIKFGAGDVLIADASDHAISSGDTSAAVLARAARRGAELFSLPNLHAKIMLLGGAAVIGSANVSESSATSMIEAALVTDDPSAVGMATALIVRLKEQAQPIDEAFLLRISAIKVKRRAWRRGRAKKVRVDPHQSWIIRVYEENRDRPDEAEGIAAGQNVAAKRLTRKNSEPSWIRWIGNSRFRTEAKEGDTVIQVWSTGAQTRPSVVYKHTQILHRQNEPKCTRFYVEARADEDETSLPWGEFKALLKKVKLSDKKVSARLIDERRATALSELWTSS